MMIRVVKPGLLSSVQDLGRWGHQRHGVIVSGAMDELAHRAANLLLGNAEDAATLEMTLVGPVLEIVEDGWIALTGGDLGPSIDGVPVPLWRPVYVKAPATLTFGAAQSGCRSYLAIAGGIRVPSVMGSYSTYLRAGIGGYEGRALRSGDQLAPLTSGSLQGDPASVAPIALSDRMRTVNWALSSRWIPFYSAEPTVRFVRGPQSSWFKEESLSDLQTARYQVTGESDRMGYRLSGPPLELREKREPISEAVAGGSLQVPPDGNPILLLADHQTTGGYPKPAVVATVDLPLIAQLKPGDYLHFREIPLSEAHAALRRRTADLKEWQRAIRMWGIG